MSKSAAISDSQKPHSIALHDRQFLQLTGINKVIAFDENQILVKTETGDLTISGNALHVSSLQLEEGRMSIDGQIDALVYAHRASRRLRDLFK